MSSCGILKGIQLYTNISVFNMSQIRINKDNITVWEKEILPLIKNSNIDTLIVDNNVFPVYFHNNNSIQHLYNIKQLSFNNMTYGIGFDYTLVCEILQLPNLAVLKMRNNIISIYEPRLIAMTILLKISDIDLSFGKIVYEFRHGMNSTSVFITIGKSLHKLNISNTMIGTDRSRKDVEIETVHLFINCSDESSNLVSLDLNGFNIRISG